VSLGQSGSGTLPIPGNDDDSLILMETTDGLPSLWLIDRIVIRLGKRRSDEN
jgi:hypothetical protein